MIWLINDIDNIDVMVKCTETFFGNWAKLIASHIEQFLVGTRLRSFASWTNRKEFMVSAALHLRKSHRNPDLVWTGYSQNFASVIKQLSMCFKVHIWPKTWEIDFILVRSLLQLPHNFATNVAIFVSIAWSFQYHTKTNSGTWSKPYWYLAWWELGGTILLTHFYSDIVWS